MEELLWALLSAFSELLFEAFLEVVVAATADLLVRAFRNLFAETNAINPILAAIVYLLIGGVLGGASLHFFPRPMFHPSRFHGISLVLSPVITGLVMLRVGVLLRRNGKESVRIESFGYGFTFALGMAIIRLAFVK